MAKKKVKVKVLRPGCTIDGIPSGQTGKMDAEVAQALEAKGHVEVVRDGDGKGDGPE